VLFALFVVNLWNQYTPEILKELNARSGSELQKSQTHVTKDFIAIAVTPSAGLENTAILLNGQAVIKSGDITSSDLIIDLIEDVTLNTSGQLAFQATFVDPATGAFFEEGVFLTRVIPEPSGILLVAFSLVALLTSRRFSAVG